MTSTLVWTSCWLTAPAVLTMSPQKGHLLLENIWSFALSLSLSSEQPKFLLLLTALTNTPKHMLSKVISAKFLVC